MIRSESLESEHLYLRILGTAGASSVPTEVEELSACIAGKMALVQMMGYAQDEATSARLPDEEWSTGEAYTNLREAWNKLNIREQELWGIVGYDVILETT